MKKMVAVALFALSAASASANAEIAPDVLARSVTDEVMTIVRADKELQAGSAQRLAQLVEAKVLPHFNFTHMTQLALGRNWRQASPEQQKLLIDEFRALLVRTYTTALMQYREQTVDYKPLRSAPTDTEVVVKSLIKQPAGQPVTIDYNMEKLGDTWKVYDVRIEGISLVENYRSTFRSEIQKNGMDGLIKALADKNKALGAQTANR
ncbi:MAG: phospholipid transport system substrate-binding protein [Betaproteobacteria bacterium]|jgi:phospholipid transport system substrate-binding protein